MRVQRLRATAISYPYIIRTDKHTKLSGLACPIGLETRIDVPALAFFRSIIFHGDGPFFAEANFVEPVAHGKNRHERSKWSKHGCPGLAREKRSDDAENIRGEPAVAAVFSRNAAPAGAQSGEKLVGVSCARNFRVSETHACEGMRVAASNGDFPETRGEVRGALVGLAPQLAVAHFISGNVGLEPGEVFGFAVAGETGEDVIRAEKEF